MTDPVCYRQGCQRTGALNICVTCIQRMETRMREFLANAKGLRGRLRELTGLADKARRWDEQQARHVAMLSDPAFGGYVGPVLAITDNVSDEDHQRIKTFVGECLDRIEAVEEEAKKAIALAEAAYASAPALHEWLTNDLLHPQDDTVEAMWSIVNAAGLGGDDA